MALAFALGKKAAEHIKRARPPRSILPPLCSAKTILVKGGGDTCGLDVNNDMVATVDDENIYLWREDHPLQTIACEASPKGIRFSYDGKYLAAAGFDACVSIYDVHRPEKPNLLLKKREHGRNVWDVDWSRDGTMICSGGYDGKWIMWDVRLPEKVTCSGAYGNLGCVYRVCLTADGHTLAAASGHTPGVSVWDTRKPDTPVMNLGDFSQRIGLSPNGRWVAGIRYWNSSGFIWDVQTKSVVLSLAKGGPVCWSPDGSLLAVSGKLDGRDAPETMLLEGKPPFRKLCRVCKESNALQWCRSLSRSYRQLLATREQDGCVTLWIVKGEGVLPLRRLCEFTIGEHEELWAAAKRRLPPILRKELSEIVPGRWK